MSYGFEVGRTYNRRQDIHARFGGQQQGGIITPKAQPVVIIITGEDGLTHGYADRSLPDGTFEYFGEGQIGDMQWVRGNRAIRDHSLDGKSLLLFRKTSEGLRFINEMVYSAHHIERAPDSKGTERDAIVFELRQLEAVGAAVDNATPDTSNTLSELRRRAFEAAGVRPPKPGSKPRTIYQRAADVRDYVLARAVGLCEGCGAPAPFKRPVGSPYLEPHHIRRVSDGGRMILAS